MSEEYIRKADAKGALSCSEIPNSSDSISRQAAIDALDRIFNNVPMELTTEILRFRRELRALPSADVAPVVHAKWENYSPVTIKCSRCGHVIHDWRYSECKYCPNCGAKMDAR